MKVLIMLELHYIETDSEDSVKTCRECAYTQAHLTLHFTQMQQYPKSRVTAHLCHKKDVHALNRHFNDYLTVSRRAIIGYKILILK